MTRGKERLAREARLSYSFATPSVPSKVRPMLILELEIGKEGREHLPPSLPSPLVRAPAQHSGAGSVALAASLKCRVSLRSLKESVYSHMQR